jgi:hypothetical protein
MMEVDEYLCLINCLAQRMLAIVANLENNNQLELVLKS